MMKFQQLRYLVEIEKQGINISNAGSVLCTSQSGISKQISLLEDELGVGLKEMAEN
jgi:LysR family cys regulon transcriptional activator